MALCSSPVPPVIPTVTGMCWCSRRLRYWANIGHVVYAMTEKDLLSLTGGDPQNPTFDLPCREVFAHGQKPIQVTGPFPELAPEAAKAHEGFWNN